MADQGVVALRILRSANDIAVLRAFRSATSAQLSILKQAITQHTPITIGALFGSDNAETQKRLWVLLEELEQSDTEYEILVDGQTESRQYLANVLHRESESRLHTRMMTDLEIGEPDIETLAWLQRESPDDVFRETLKQIVHGEGYDVSPETLAWARRQLGDA